jgi:hypothetical protein
VRLPEPAKRWIRELRKWNLAPLGAVLVVIILAAGAFAFVTTAGDKPTDYEGMIRAYFATKPGGRMPADQVRLITVTSCVPLDREARGGRTTYRCSLSFEDQGFVACFAFDQRRVAVGSVELGSPDLGCDRVGWDAKERSLVSL